MEIHYINVSDVYFTNLCCRTSQRESKTSNEDKEGGRDADSLSLVYNSSEFFVFSLNILLMTWIS